MASALTLEQVLGVPTEQLPGVLAQLTPDQQTQLRLAMSGGGTVRYKGDPFASQAAQGYGENWGGAPSEFKRAALGSLAEAYDPSIGGVDVQLNRNGQVSGFGKSGEYTQLALREAGQNPLLGGDTTPGGQVGASFSAFEGPEAETRFGSAIKSDAAQQQIGQFKDIRQQALDQILGGGTGTDLLGRGDIEEALRNTRFDPYFGSQMEAKLGSVAKERAMAQAGGGNFLKSFVLPAASVISAPFTGGAGMGLAMSGMALQNEKADRERSKLEQAMTDLDPVFQPGIDFSGDIFSRRQTGSRYKALGGF